MLLAACAATAPADDLTSIVSQSQKDSNPDGSKSYHKAGNGTKAEEESHLEDASTKKETTEGWTNYDYNYDQDYDNVTWLVAEKVIAWRGYFRG